MEKLINSLRESLIVPAIFVLLLWAIHGTLYVLHIDAGNYGLTPRTLEGLWGIITSPLVHANITHLASNSLPLFVLSTGVIYFYRQSATQAIVLIYFLTQVFVWAFARGQLLGHDGLNHPVTHLGISGVVYGLFAFVLGMGFFQRNIKSIILALLVITYYGSMIWGIFPFQTGVSFESHLFGAIVGLIIAFAFQDIVEPDDEVTSGNQQSFRINRRVTVDKSNRPSFLDPYTFDGLREKYNAPPPVFEDEQDPITQPSNAENPVTQQVYDEWLIMREKLRLNENWQNLEQNIQQNLDKNIDQNNDSNKTSYDKDINNDVNKSVDNPASGTRNDGIINNTVNNNVENDNSGKKPPFNGWYISNSTWE